MSQPHLIPQPSHTRPAYAKDPPFLCRAAARSCLCEGSISSPNALTQQRPLTIKSKSHTLSPIFRPPSLPHATPTLPHAAPATRLSLVSGLPGGPHRSPERDNTYGLSRTPNSETPAVTSPCLHIISATLAALASSFSLISAYSRCGSGLESGLGLGPGPGLGLPRNAA